MELDEDLEPFMASVVKWPEKPSGYEMGRMDRTIKNLLKKYRQTSFFRGGQGARGV